MARAKMLKLPELLAEIDMSRAAFYRMCAKGKGPKTVRLPNGHLRFREADIDRWLATLDDSAAA